MTKKIAFVRCSGGTKAKDKYIYEGIKSCQAANFYAGGQKACFYGCLGYGDCVDVCEFDAIYMGDDNLPHVIDEKCVGCGACVEACPKGIIELVPEDQNIIVACISNDAGKVVREVCKTGCIACRICEKNCPYNAIYVENNVAIVDYEKCTSCGICVAKCPTKVIADKIKYRPKMVIQNNCVGCTKCAKVCPVNAISGNLKEKHTIDPEKCIGCGECIKVCPVGAITQIGKYN